MPECSKEGTERAGRDPQQAPRTEEGLERSSAAGNRFLQRAPEEGITLVSRGADET